MPDIGQIWKDSAGQVHVYAWFGRVPTPRWVPVNPGLCEQLRDLPNGTVVDLKQLPEVVVVREPILPPTQLDEETFEALLTEAEQTGKEM